LQTWYLLVENRKFSPLKPPKIIAFVVKIVVKILTLQAELLSN